MLAHSMARLYLSHFIGRGVHVKALFGDMLETLRIRAACVDDSQHDVPPCAFLPWRFTCYIQEICDEII